MKEFAPRAPQLQVLFLFVHVQQQRVCDIVTTPSYRMYIPVMYIYTIKHITAVRAMVGMAVQ